MNEVSVYMDACVRVWGKGGRESWLARGSYFTYLACIEFSDNVHNHHYVILS